ncbi:MAG: hypothetical protein JWP95_778 [Actinotalea sp.]|nr:hypothetical protein [Actinotalea sp.]
MTEHDPAAAGPLDPADRAPARPTDPALAGPSARASAIIGRIAVLTCWIPFLNIVTGLAAVVGLVLGIRVVRRADADARGVRRMAVWGIWFCAAAIVVTVAASLALADVLS